MRIDLNYKNVKILGIHQLPERKFYISLFHTNVQQGGGHTNDIWNKRNCTHESSNTGFPIAKAHILIQKLSGIGIYSGIFWKRI